MSISNTCFYTKHLKNQANLKFQNLLTQFTQTTIEQNFEIFYISYNKNRKSIGFNNKNNDRKLKKLN